ncbi:hypothetical protein SBADM41S_06869 [Streptomyces badius]
MVPTLDLLAQTAQAWRAVGHRAPMVAVCSLENDPVLRLEWVRTTTNPIQLALWAGTGPMVVFATYASLVDREDITAPTGRGRFAVHWRPPWRAGSGCTDSAWTRLTSRSWTRRMEPLVILGGRGQQSTTTSRIPADFRLYLAATRASSPQPAQKGGTAEEAEIATMADDPEGTYGAWLAELGLSEAIEREILAGFEIDVLEIRDPSPILGESEEARRRPAAGSVADRALGARGRAEPPDGDDVPPEG